MIFTQCFYVMLYINTIYLILLCNTFVQYANVEKLSKNVFTSMYLCNIVVLTNNTANTEEIKMENMIAIVKRNTWTVGGIEIGNQNSSFENCFITDKDMTEKEVITAIQNEYMEKGYIVTSASLYEQEEIKIDLLEKKIIQ